MFRLLFLSIKPLARWKCLWTFWLITITVLSYRMFFGIDFTDEAHYLSVPLRFAKGDRPFLDELYFLQTSAFFLLPFVKIYRWLFPNLEGVVVTFRFLYLGFSLLIALFTGFVFRAVVKAPGMGGSLLLLAFIPYNVPGLSYNTLGVGFMFCAILASILEKKGQAKSWTGLMIGGFGGIAVFCYPTLFGALVLLFGWILVTTKSPRVPLALALLAGALFPIGLLLFFIEGSLLDIVRAVHFTRENVCATFSCELGPRLVSAGKALVGNTYRLVVPFLFLWGSDKMGKKWGAGWGTCFFGMFFFSLVLLTRPSLGGTGTHGLIAYLGLLSPYFVYMSGRRDLWPTTALIFGTCVAVLLTMTFTSSNQFNAGSNAMALSAAWALQILLSERSAFYVKNRTFLMPLFLGAIVSIVLAYQLLQQNHGKRELLSEQLREGPYKFLRTTPEMKTYYEELMDLRNSVAVKGGRVWIYPFLPAGYLFFPERPLTPNVYSNCTSVNQSVCDRIIQTQRSKSDIYLKVFQVRQNQWTIFNFDTEETEFDRRYTRLAKRYRHFELRYSNLE